MATLPTSGFVDDVSRSPVIGRMARGVTLPSTAEMSCTANTPAAWYWRQG